MNADCYFSAFSVFFCGFLFFLFCADWFSVHLIAVGYIMMLSSVWAEHEIKLHRCSNACGRLYATEAR